MNERLLQYLWQFQYFNKQALQLESGEAFHIIYPGQFNTNQGPDFLYARIKIEGTLWVGHVELHVKTSDWYKHAHQLDHNYDNVVLHVVWENDEAGTINNIPLFVLQSRIPGLLLQQYTNWMNNPSFIACEGKVREVPRIVWAAWKERLLAERLQRKAQVIFTYLQQNNQHWEESFWWLLARNFGVTVNAEPFEAIAQSLPVTLLAKHRNQIHQLEALLLGQAGLLKGPFEDKYPQLLQKEYHHLQKKYNLQPVPQTVHFLRMRPGNFPTVRLAQLAMLIHQSSHLFTFIKDTGQLAAIKKLLTVTANDFWHYHYTFTELSSFQPKTLGHQMVHTLIINTIVPILFAYGLMHNEEQYKNKALHWLEELPAEKNTIIHGFAALGINSKDAYDSQALLELKSRYCDHKKCLDCSAGNALLKGYAAAPSGHTIP
jgi:hypothetical protein